MASRYTRDEILIQGIELAQTQAIAAHDMPGDTIAINAYSIKWLQNAMDMFHRRYPFSTDVTSTSITISAGSTDARLTSDVSKYLPLDFILDVKDGVLASIGGKNVRVYRKNFQTWLDYSLAVQGSTQAAPKMYTIINDRLTFQPLLSSTTACTLWYYALPAPLSATDKPRFPDEWTLIEFIRLKCHEWTHSIEPGSAQQYMTKELSRLRSTGLLHETEYDSIPLRNNQVFVENTPTYGWMER